MPARSASVSHSFPSVSLEPMRRCCAGAIRSRGYGLASLFILLAIGCLWALMQEPTARRFAVATVVSVLSVHCLFQNAVLLGAICLAGMAVCVMRRQNRTAGLVFAVGAISAVTLLPYYSLLTSAEAGWVVLRSGFQGPMVLFMLGKAVDSPPYLGPWLWLAVVVFTVGVGVAALDRQSRVWRVTAADLPLFAGAAAGFGAVGYFIFLGIARLPTQPWYYLPLIVFIAGCADAALAHWFERQPRRWAIAAAALCWLLCPSPRTRLVTARPMSICSPRISITTCRQMTW